METPSNAPTLSDPKLPVKPKLSALWTSVMFCYIYADYFELFKPGKLQRMIAGNEPTEYVGLRRAHLCNT